MLREKLTHSLRCSEFIELTLIINVMNKKITFSGLEKDFGYIGCFTCYSEAGA